MYKASRRREYERLRLMQSEIDNEKNKETWEKEREEAKRRDEEKTEKNRRRREKKKTTRGKKGGENGGNVGGGTGPSKAPTKLSAGPDAMVTNEDQYGVGADGQVPQQEVPGVIIHDDD